MRFVASFIGWLVGFAVVFELSRTLWVHVYMLPLTHLAGLALGVLGLPAQVV